METPREIAADSLEAFCTRYDAGACREDPSGMPPEWLDEDDALWDGTAVLRLPDGSRWLSSWSLPVEYGDDEGIAGYLREHAVLRQHTPASQPPEMFLNADTLDVRHAFCTACRQFVNLDAEWRQGQAQREPRKSPETVLPRTASTRDGSPDDEPNGTHNDGGVALTVEPHGTAVGPEGTGPLCQP